MNTPCTQWERITKIEWWIDLTNKDIRYMTAEISEIKQDVKEIKTHLLEELPKIYATKKEVADVKGDILRGIQNTNQRKITWIQQWWAIIVAIISALSFIVTSMLNK